MKFCINLYSYAPMERVKGQNMTKRIISLAVVAMMLVAIAIIPAAAAEGGSTVQPKATCSYCGSSQTITYGSWVNYKTAMTTCTHYDHGYDNTLYWRRMVYRECSGCSNGDSDYYQYKTEISACYGYDAK